MDTPDKNLTAKLSSVGQNSNETRRRLRLGEILVQEGLISEAQVEAALEKQKLVPGKRLGEILVHLRMIDEKSIVKALAKRLGLPLVDLNDVQVSEAALKEMPAHVMRDHTVVPISVDDESITVGFGDPLSLDAVNAVRFSCQKRLIEVICPPSQIKRFVNRSTSISESREEFEIFLQSLTDENNQHNELGENAAVRLVNKSY